MTPGQDAAKRAEEIERHAVMVWATWWGHQGSPEPGRPLRQAWAASVPAASKRAWRGVGQFVAAAVAEAVKERGIELSKERVRSENDLRHGYGRRLKEQQDEVDKYHGLLCIEIDRVKALKRELAEAVKEREAELANLRVLHEANCHYKRELAEARREERATWIKFHDVFGSCRDIEGNPKHHADCPLDGPPASAPEGTGGGK